MRFVDQEDIRFLETYLWNDENIKVCKCKISFSNNIWCISEWFTVSGYQHQGYGLQTLRHAFQYLLAEKGIPQEIRYFWNGANDYVMEWITKHFDARSIETEPYLTAEQTRKSNIFVLDKEKVLHYLGDS